MPFSSFVFAPPTTPSLDIAPWVRLLLTGSPSSPTPDTGTITLLTPGVIQEINQRFPACLSLAPGGLLGDDLAAYNEAVGSAIAAKLVLTPGGQQWAQYVVSSKIGPVTRTRQAPAQTAGEASQTLQAASGAALTRIECIREILAATPRPGLLSLAGRRRSLGCGCG